MKHNFKRTLSLLMALVMALSCMSLSAFAEGDVAQIGETGYETLEAAFATAESGDTIKLLSTINYVGEGIEIAGKAITLDMDGKTITFNNCGLFDVSANGDLTITGNGTITGPTGAAAAALDGKALIYIGEQGALTIENGTLTAGGVDDCGMYGIYAYDDGTVTLGTKNGNGPTITSWFAPIGENHMHKPATFVIYSGAYTSQAAPAATDWWSYFCAPIYAAAAGSITINGGEFNGYYAISDRYVDVEQTLTINGGTFNGTSGTALFVDSVNGSNDTSDRTIAITGGTFSSDPSEYLPANYVANLDGNVYVVAPMAAGQAVASIVKGGAIVNYTTLADAFAAAEAGDVVKMANDVILSAYAEVAAGKEFTLDLNGKTITSVGTALDVYGNLTVTDTSEGASGAIDSGKQGIYVDAGGSVVFNKGTIDAVNMGFRVEANASVTINGGTITANNYAVYNEGTTAINGGALTGKVGGVSNMGTLTVADGTIASADGHGVETLTGAATTISGGTVTGGSCGVFIRGNGTEDSATLTVTDGTINGGSYGISGNGSTGQGGTVINISGGAVNETGSNGGGALYHPQVGTLSVTGGTFNGENGIQLCSGEGIFGAISGATVTATGSDNRASKTGDGFIDDGAALSIVNRSYPGGTPQLTVEGGTFVSEQSEAVLAYTWSSNTASEWTEAGTYLSISGGTFSSKPAAAYLASGKAAVKVSGMWQVNDEGQAVSGSITGGTGENEATIVVESTTTDATETTTYTYAPEGPGSAVVITVTETTGEVPTMDINGIEIEVIADDIVGEDQFDYNDVAVALIKAYGTAVFEATTEAVIEVTVVASEPTPVTDNSGLPAYSYDIMPVAILTADNDEFDPVEIEDESLSGSFVVPVPVADQNAKFAYLTHGTDTAIAQVNATTHTANITVLSFSPFTSRTAYTVASVTNGTEVTYYESFAEAAAAAVVESTTAVADAPLLTMLADANDAYTLGAGKTLKVKNDGDEYGPFALVIESGVESKQVDMAVADANNHIYTYTVENVDTYSITATKDDVKPYIKDGTFDIVSVPVTVNGTNGKAFYGVDFTVSYDSRIFSDVMFAGNGDGNVNTSSSVSGNTKTTNIMFESSGILSDTTIGELVFITVENVHDNDGTLDGKTAISFSNPKVNPDEAHLITVDATMSNIEIDFAYLATVTSKPEAAGEINAGNDGTATGVYEVEQRDLQVGSTIYEDGEVTAWVIPGTKVVVTAIRKTGYGYIELEKKVAADVITINDDKALNENTATQSFIMPVGTANLFAKFEEYTYTIKLDGNGGAATPAPADVVLNYTDTWDVVPNPFSKTGNHFTGWNTKADGSGTAVSGSFVVSAPDNLALFDANRELTLYAQWAPNTYTIHFDGNTATGGEMSNMTPVTYGTNVALTANAFTKTGSTFAGWATTAAGAATYLDQANVAVADLAAAQNVVDTNEATINLYAVWTVNKYNVKFDFADATITDVTIKRDFNSELVDADEPALDTTKYGLVSYVYGTSIWADFDALQAAPFTVPAEDATITVNTYRKYTVTASDDFNNANPTTATSKDAYSATINPYDAGAFTYTVSISGLNDNDEIVTVNATVDGNIVSFAEGDLAGFKPGATLTLSVVKTIANVQVEVYPLSNSIVLVTAYSPSDAKLSYNATPMYKDARVAKKTFMGHSNLSTYAILLDINKVTGYIGDKMDMGEFKTWIENSGLITVNNGSATEITSSYNVNKTGVVDVADVTLTYNAYIGSYAYTANNVTGILTSRDQQYLLSDATLTKNGVYDLEANASYYSIGPDYDATQLINITDVLEVYNNSNAKLGT